MQSQKWQHWINCRRCHLKTIGRKWPQLRLSSCGRARWILEKATALWLTLLSVAIVRHDSFTLGLTARHNEFEAAQKRLLRYISLGVPRVSLTQKYDLLRQCYSSGQIFFWYSFLWPKYFIKDDINSYSLNKYAIWAYQGKMTAPHRLLWKCNLF